MDAGVMAKRPPDSDEDILTEAKERWERCVTWYASARANMLEDQKFAEGDSRNTYQWDRSVINARGDRPCITNNKTRQHNLQICNDARQHKAQIKITPTGGRATYEAAQVMSGIVRRIEYQSKATDAYSTGIFHMVQSGLGFCKVETDYSDDETFDLEIFIRRVKNPRTIYLDPDAEEYDKSDGRFAFEFRDIPRDLYEAEHGKEDMSAPAALDNTGDDWNDQDHVRTAKYWRRIDAGDKLLLLTDGSTVRESELEPEQLKAIDNQIVKSRPVPAWEVECITITGDRIDSRDKWPGKYIPIVPFIGEETVIDGVLDLKGHTRCLIGAQQTYNYMGSQAVEQVSMQTKTPYIGDIRAFEGRPEWYTANTTNWPFLGYNGVDDAGQKIDRPAREQPPVMADGYLKGMEVARQDMMMVSGQYQANVGAQSNEISGTAIQQRQRQGDNATYHYIDNPAKAIRQVGRIVMDLIPKVYDVARVMKMLGEDGSDSDVHLVPNAPDAHQHVAMTPQGPQPLTPQQADAQTADPNQPNPAVIFNPRIGKYDVEADVGPAYATQREEAANAFSQIMARNPAAFQVIGDFWAKNSDFPGADELAERLQKGLPPQYKEGQPDPQVQQLTQAIQQQGQQAHELLGKADAELAQLKQQIAQLQTAAKDKDAETAIKDYDAETRRMSAVGAVDPTAIKVLVRSMLSEMLQMPALPVMHEHDAADAEHQQAIAPPEPQPTNGAAQP
jgi:hypothetical protein